MNKKQLKIFMHLYTRGVPNGDFTCYPLAILENAIQADIKKNTYKWIYL